MIRPFAHLLKRIRPDLSGHHLSFSKGKLLPATTFIHYQLKECRNSIGERLVLVLNNLLKDCRCSKPNS